MSHHPRDYESRTVQVLLQVTEDPEWEAVNVLGSYKDRHWIPSPVKLNGITPTRFAGTTCPISSAHFGADQNLFDVWEDRGLVKRECPPGQIPERKVHHVES